MENATTKYNNTMSTMIMHKDEKIKMQLFLKFTENLQQNDCLSRLVR